MDPISDMLAIIKNGITIREKKVIVSCSLIKIEILRILKNEKYISDFKKISKDNKDSLEITLLYQGKIPAISSIKRVSKPGLRIYRGYKKISRPMSGMGLAILSTPQGIMSGKNAFKKKLGGEIICEVC